MGVWAKACERKSDQGGIERKLKELDVKEGELVEKIRPRWD